MDSVPDYVGEFEGLLVAIVEPITEQADFCSAHGCALGRERRFYGRLYAQSIQITDFSRRHPSYLQGTHPRMPIVPFAF